MADIINLRQARKAKARLTRERQAAENRARFGRSKAERDAQAAEQERQAKIVYGARRDEKALD